MWGARPLFFPIWSPYLPGSAAGRVSRALGCRSSRLTGGDPATSITLKGEVATPSMITLAELASMPRVEQVSDLHCVTTWSYCGIRWSGFRFRDVHTRLILPRVNPRAEARWVVFRGADGYRASLLLDDALG
ncbi:MAG: molybdopterin-dependent oxidoreductase, partial [Acidobacteria bacterium]|nr:molybdopterin-dependent oxidoreductase [Acidobacteriota bacterium]